ncbi:hypothetical protein [Nisaea sp.]|uniref:hypothetical protein n=1 Tax=Nisaea sp. TaxID=2024842 RepID=UPI003B51B2F4
MHGVVGVIAILVIGYVLSRFFGSNANAFPRPNVNLQPPPSGVYEELVSNRVPSVNHINAWAQTPTTGGAVINNYNFGQLSHANVLALSSRLHNQITNHWAWGPAGAGTTDLAGARLLDDNITAGECGYIAHALNVLLTQNNPYGAQQGANNFTVRTYSGQHPANRVGAKNGFIAAHANVPLGLHSNVWNPNGNSAAYYLWMNHKVLEYNGRFYDPTYDQTQGGPGWYGNLAAMAAAQIYGAIQPGNNQFGNIPVDQVVMSDDAAPPALKGFFIVTYMDRTTRRLIARPYNVATDDKVVIGPFNPTPNTGATANSFNYNNGTDYLQNMAQLQ